MNSKAVMESEWLTTETSIQIEMISVYAIVTILWGDQSWSRGANGQGGGESSLVFYEPDR
jgi:hypothetical protein